MSTRWNIDTTHIGEKFKGKHLVISTVTGQFNKFEGRSESDSDVFDAEKFSHIKFMNRKLTKSGDNFKEMGDLTVRDITKPITLEEEQGGSMVAGYGQNEAGFEIIGKINRNEIGLTWNAVTEVGGIVVVVDVKLILNFQVTQS